MTVRKVIALTLLLPCFAIAADKTENVNFKPISAMTNDDSLNASTGSAFKDALPSYENDGNENTTTRAGLRIRKSSVIVALEHNLGINAANKLSDVSKFVTQINKILPAESQLQKSDLNNLDSVVISMQPGSQDVLTDIVPDTKMSPITNVNVLFTLTAKEGQTIGKQNAHQLVLSGQTKVKVTDYRRVDQSTLMAAKKPAHITIDSKKPGQVTDRALADALNQYFDISADSFATPLFPIWNVDVATNQPMFTDKTSGEPVKHSLKSDQVNALAEMYTGLDGNGSGDFGKARIERAVQKVSFAPTADTKLTKSKNNYNGYYDVTITFIQHWSWNKAPYSEKAASFTLKDVPIDVTYKNKM